MEAADMGDDGQAPQEGWKKDLPPPAVGEKPTKRKMKSPYQLEILEKTYAVEAYPSEALRAELSTKIGLSDRQLQMWFCHRRLKDRKPPSAKKPKKEEELLSSLPEAPVPLPASEVISSSAPAHNPFGEPRKAISRMTYSAPRMGMEMPAAGMGKRYYDTGMMMAPLPPSSSHLSVTELQVIASVEAQLGEPLREDGPILGLEFDPLPPGAFGAPIVSDTPAYLIHGRSATHSFLDRLENPALSGQQKLPARTYNGRLLESHELKPIKTSAFLPSTEHVFLPGSSSGKRKATNGSHHYTHSQVGSRAPHEYQFLPEQPSGRADSYERVSQSHYYDSLSDIPNARVSSLPLCSQYVHGNETVPTSYTFQGQMSSPSLLAQQGREQVFPSSLSTYDALGRSSYTSPTSDVPCGVDSAVSLENPFLPSDKMIYNDEDDPLRIEPKRKNEEARIAKEIEAHEKRIRKDLEKQDVIRRKKEEQLRKETERLDRERRKEEEKKLREKQREDERFQREQRREFKRREKFLLKESLRAEKLRQRAEMKKEKEAAKQKAVNERATARRIAKEYMEHVEDERLELMELAASSKGLPSIISLDSDTLQRLDMFRDMLAPFPPTSVCLKKPLSIQPWSNSDVNIGYLLMVWKFLLNFASVLELWPFTLDEFVQALHDHDSRLLGEIHVSLLKLIIKDIEDVARTPAMAFGTSLNGASNPGGGHPQVVEGAYAWGFDICCWQHHLNYITWPEILRQFALAAGFGPLLKKKNSDSAYFREDNEGNDGEDVISTLRNGAAAESAVAWMHERGFTRRRRSRHRLTPGTVKFAAFHVLSLEGSHGLTILEVAEKIQKSGLRDLTTSKTPEASIAAALSRDTKLFERTAPSTYCVRSPYRKDPIDADAILSAAREKIQIFQNGLSDSEEAEKDVEDGDDAERDEDSDCDGEEDPELDDADAATENNKKPSSKEINVSKGTSAIDNVKEEVYVEAGATMPDELKNSSKGPTSLHFSSTSKDFGLSGGLNDDQFLVVDANLHETSKFGLDYPEVDGSNCASWVQGLTEDEYSDLSVEERLNALVALIGVAIEGNSIRVILEERLEAANALKKQMWSEAQLDKRRSREECIARVQSSSLVFKAEASSPVHPTVEGVGSPVDNFDERGNDENSVINQGQFLDPQNMSNLNILSERNISGQEYSTNPDIAQCQQYGYAAEKSRSQLKSYIGHKAEEMYGYRSLPLGQDRRRNRYWQFSTSASRNDPGSGRIFFESRDGFWRLIDTEEAFDALVASLDTRGIRESHLLSMLQRIETTFRETVQRRKQNISAGPSEGSVIKSETSNWICNTDGGSYIDSPTSTICAFGSEALEWSPSFKVELGRNDVEKNAILERYQCFMGWMWKESYNPYVLCAMKYGKKRCAEVLQTCHSCFQSYFPDDRHCNSCHKIIKVLHSGDGSFSEHVRHCEEKRRMGDSGGKVYISDSTPIRFRLIKAQLAFIEASIPEDALQAFWSDGYRRSWGARLKTSVSSDELFQVLNLLEAGIKRDCISSSYKTTAELLNTSSAASSVSVPSSSEYLGSVPVLPWVPATTAAVALRLFELDASISYMLHQKSEFRKEREDGDFIKFPSGFSALTNDQELGPMYAMELADYQKDARWLDPVSGRRGRGRGRGRGAGKGRGRGGRGPRGVPISRTIAKPRGVSNYEKTTRKYTTRGRARGRGRRGGGRRPSIRPTQILNPRIPDAGEIELSGLVDVGPSVIKESSDDSPPSLVCGRRAWGQGAGPGARRFSESDEDDDRALASDDEFEEDQLMHFPGHYVEDKSAGPVDDESDNEDTGEGDEEEGVGEYDEGLEVNDDMDEDDVGAVRGDEDGDDIEVGGPGNDGRGDEDDDEGASSYSDYSD